MVAEGPEDDLLLDPNRDLPPGRGSARAIFLKFVIYLTFITAFIFLVISIFLVLSPSWGSSLYQPITPYFFIFLGVFFLIPVPLVSVFVVMFALYIVFFIALIFQSNRDRKKQILDTPIGYYVAVATAVELIAIIISRIEALFGTPIGGGGIDSELQNNPLVGYMSLIYAPFVEELGFRILPLGLYSFILTAYVSVRKSRFVNFRDSLLSIIIPGHLRRKYDVRLSYVDWALILATSAIFAYAHIYFGAWDWGKFIPVFITGIALAVGYLKFGIYVDIPLHWFFNGFVTLYYLNPVMELPTGFLVIWILFAGVVSLIAIVAYLRSRRLSGIAAT